MAIESQFLSRESTRKKMEYANMDIDQSEISNQDKAIQKMRRDMGLEIIKKNEIEELPTME